MAFVPVMTYGYQPPASDAPLIAIGVITAVFVVIGIILWEFLLKNLLKKIFHIKSDDVINAIGMIFIIAIFFTSIFFLARIFNIGG